MTGSSTINEVARSVHDTEFCKRFKEGRHTIGNFIRILNERVDKVQKRVNSGRVVPNGTGEIIFKSRGLVIVRRKRKRYKTL